MKTFSIGAVIICHSGVNPFRNSLIGNERVAALRQLYRGEPLPGLDVYGDMGGGPFVPITRNQVNWATAGKRVTT